LKVAVFHDFRQPLGGGSAAGDHGREGADGIAECCVASPLAPPADADASISQPSALT
jgi:hypothetical protein